MTSTGGSMNTTTVSQWKPLLEGNDAVRAHRIAKRIADELSASGNTGGFSDLFSPVLDAHLARVFDSDHHADRALTAVANCAGQAANLSSHALYGGLSGLGWVLGHVTKLLNCGIETDDADPLDLIDRTLNQTDAHKSERYDFISGVAGIATYAFERMPRDEPRALLERIIDRLAADAEMTSTGVTWYTPASQLPDYQRDLAPNGYYNLGVAHGIPALAVTFARAIRFGIRSAVSSELLDGLMRWLFSQRSEEGIGGRFARWVPKGLPPLGTSTREAWCYGGLGLSVALFHAARLVKDERDEAQVLDVARLEAARPAAHSGVDDMCLCHGGGGNAHLYNRLYQATGEDVFYRAARKWLHATIDAAKEGRGIGGYLFSRPNAENRTSLLPERSFLSGSAGVGLALLAASSSYEPSWDSLLLADLPLRRSPRAARAR
jgi:lantibiotic biosynthesis protein